MGLFPKLESSHFDWNKQKRKSYHIEWDIEWDGVSSKDK